MRLEELHFKNYRLFQELNITGLKRVNLIAGKNNTGKTALLEGIRILASRGDATVVNHILDNRGEFTPSRDASYNALFSDPGRAESSGKETPQLRINELRIKLDENRKLSTYKKFQIYFEENLSHSLDPNSSIQDPNDAVVYIPYLNQLSQLKNLYDNIQLTPKEDDVLHILQETILPDLKRMAFAGDQFKMLLNTHNESISIGRLGDGVQRILGIALALANSQNKILLIDEFELGLHHSIQEQLWDLVFKYSEKWNIQSFITTHSEDTLHKFYYVASKEIYRKHAAFIRLQYSRYDELEAIVYDIDRLEKALELDLEIR